MIQRRATTGRVVAGTLLVLMVSTAPAFDRSLEDDCQGEGLSCLACAIFCRYGGVLELARVEVGALDKGVVVHYMADDPAQILDLQRFGYERQKLFGDLDDAKTLNQLCERCRQKAKEIVGARFEAANSAHGVFTVLTSDDPDVVKVLHEMASEMAIGNDVRGS